MVTPASAGTRMGSKFLACCFAPQTGCLYRSFGFSLHSQPPYCSGSGCFHALARFGFRNRSNLLLIRLILALGTLTSLRIERSSRPASSQSTFRYRPIPFAPRNRFYY